MFGYNGRMTTPVINSELENAIYPKSITAAVAQLAWHGKHKKRCPDELIPAPEDIFRLLTTDSIYLTRVNRTESEKRLSKVLGKGTWSWQVQATANDSVIAAYGLLEAEKRIRPFGLDEVHAKWLAIPPNKRPHHPLEPVLHVWQNPPVPALANLRNNPILPSRVAQVEGDHSRAGNLFTLAGYAASSSEDCQQVLPGFEIVDIEGPVLHLALYDLAVGKLPTSQAAPMPLRLWIEAILSVPLDDRLEDHPVVMSVTLREFLSWLYPGERQPRPSEYWPALNKAILALDSVDARIPWEDPLTGRGGLRRVVSVGDIPRGPGKLDDLITVIVHLPPGSGVGPVIDRQRLRFWGTRSAPAYRAMLGLAYRWFDPGKTRIPLENGRYWHQSERPQDYAKLTEQELLTCVSRPVAINRAAICCSALIRSSKP